ncbi:hypothetical protein [Actinomadura kijaniata]|uniref:hypothetical protein n=1 Tax=Actinomadura kijaniata TaxID=46161 RepID=UPI00082CDDD6|nr:hypothetical protein [Actinomadura kijaniata]
MVFQEQFDPGYWVRAEAMLSEGFCPDCDRPIDSRTITADRAGTTVEFTVLECVPCQTEWTPKAVFDQGPGWWRERRLEAIMNELRR